MGKKVTIDCATLVNKGMEIIEAKRLFGINEVDAIMHRESIVHSLVEYKDGTMKACLSNPDMEIPIQLSLSYPHRNNTSVDFLNLVKLGKLSFEVIDEKRFPCFSVCKSISDKGDYAGTIMNGANEIAVDAYLKDRISFYGIYDCIVNALQKFGDTGIIRDESDIYRIDKEVKEYTLRRIGE